MVQGLSVFVCRWQFPCLLCRPGIPKTQVLFIHDSTLFLDGGELAYLKYFLTLLLSPVPEYQAKASWLGMSQVQVRE